MPNDYSKFFSTYNNVEAPPFAMPKSILSINNPLPTISRSSSKSDSQESQSSFWDLFDSLPLESPKESSSKKVATGSIKSVMKNKGLIVTDVYNTLRSEGFSCALACGILGNIMLESSFNVDNRGDGGNSYGLYQFNKNGELPGYDTWKVKLKGNNPEHIRLTLFVVHRMNNGTFNSAIGMSASLAKGYFASDDPEKAAEGFNALFERSTDYLHPERLNNRKKYAREFYNYFNS